MPATNAQIIDATNAALECLDCGYYGAREIDDWITKEILLKIHKPRSALSPKKFAEFESFLDQRVSAAWESIEKLSRLLTDEVIESLEVRNADRLDLRVELFEKVSTLHHAAVREVARRLALAPWNILFDHALRHEIESPGPIEGKLQDPGSPDERRKQYSFCSSIISSIQRLNYSELKAGIRAECARGLVTNGSTAHAIPALSQNSYESIWNALMKSPRAYMTYDLLEDITSEKRSMISAALKEMDQKGMIERNKQRTSRVAEIYRNLPIPN